MTAQIGFLTTLLELVATSVGEGAIVGGFVMAGVGVIRGRSRREMEASALKDSFWGGFWGMFCLCFDLLAR